MYNSFSPLSDVLKLILTSFLILIGTNLTAQNTPSDISDIELVIQDGHSASITALATHPFLNQIASIDQNGELIIWDMNSRMILEKHYLGARASRINRLEYGLKGNFLTLNSFTKGFLDLSKESNSEIFLYNLISRKKFNLKYHADFTYLDFNEYVLGFNVTDDSGNQFKRITNSGILKQHTEDSSQVKQRLYSVRLIDTEADSVSDKVVITLKDGRIEVLTSDLDFIWGNALFNEAETNSSEPVIKRTEIIGDKYLAYLFNTNKGVLNADDNFKLRIRNLDNGFLEEEFDISEEPQKYVNHGFSSSDDGKYIAAYHYRSLTVIDTQNFSVVFSEKIPELSADYSNNTFAQIGGISFLRNSNKLVIARGNSLFIYDPSNNSFTTDFNTILKPEYGGEISAYGNNAYSIFNKKTGTLDIFSLQNLEQKSYDSRFFSELIKSEKISYQTGKDFTLPNTECTNCNGYGAYLSFTSKNRTASIWVKDFNDPNEHYILTFDTENWSLLNQSNSFNTQETKYEKVRRLQYFDSDRNYAFIADSVLYDVRINNQIYNLEIIDIKSNQTKFFKRKVAQLSFSENNRYWMIRDNHNMVRIYSSDSMKEIWNDSLYYDDNSSFNPNFLTRFYGDKFYYTKYKKNQDGIIQTHILGVDLINKAKEDSLNLNSILPSVFKITDDKFYLGMRFDLTEPYLNNKDSLETLTNTHGYDATLKDNISILSFENGEITNVITDQPGVYETLEIINDFIITKQVNGAISVYRKDDLNQPIKHYKNGKSNLFTNGSFYSTSKDLLPKIGLRSGESVFRVEEFDFFFNRPDTLIEQLGTFIPEELDAYKEAVAKRIRNSSLTEKSLKRMLDSEQLPELILTNLSDIEYSTTNNSTSLKLEANSSIPLKKWELTVNGIRILDDTKQILSGESHSWSYELPLIEGQNDIKIIVKNEYDVSSAPINLSINYTPKQEIIRNLYIVTIGVSDYENDLYDLKYADKDAFDLQKAFAYKDTLWSYTYDWNNTDNRDENGSPAKIDSSVGYVSNKYFLQDEIYSSFNRLSITNEEVTDNIPSKVNSFLKDSDENDVVLVFLAGHGIIDNLGDYYFGTYDIDFENPSEKGIPYNGVLSFFDGIKSRNRILFMDTCQSGELDPEMKIESQLVDQINDTSRISTNLQRNVGSLSVLGEQKEYDSFKLMKETFSGFETDGTIVISASSATGFAYETNNVKNGVFTYSVMDALMNPRKVNTDYDAGISVSELQNYLFKNVELLTNGKQVPTLRQENIQNDFRVW